MINQIREEWRSSLERYWRLVDEERERREAELTHKIEVNDLVFPQYAKPKYKLPYEPLVYVVIEVKNRLITVKALKERGESTVRRCRSDQLKKIDLEILNTQVPEQLLRRLFLIKPDSPINKQTIGERALEMGKRNRAVGKYRHKNKNSGQHLDLLRVLMNNEHQDQQQKSRRSRVTFSHVGDLLEDDEQDLPEDGMHDKDEGRRSVSPLSEASQVRSEDPRLSLEEDIAPADSASQYGRQVQSENGSLDPDTDGVRSTISRRTRSRSSTKTFFEPLSDFYSRVSSRVSRRLSSIGRFNKK